MILNYNPSIPIQEQEDESNEIIASLVAVWVESEAGILRKERAPSEGAIQGMRNEIERLCDRFGICTPAELAAAIREAARNALDSNFPQLTIKGIESEAQLMPRRRNAHLLLGNGPKWKGDPSECLDQFWPEIWKKSLEMAFEKGERCRRFEHDYIDIFTDEGRKEAKVRDLAFLELKRRVVTTLGFDADRARQLVREEMHRVLVTAFPKYKGDIERSIWAIEFEEINALSAEIHTKTSTDRHGRYMLRPTVEACGRAVYFDLYAEMMGCNWPEFVVQHAPKDQEVAPKSRWTAVPLTIDDIKID